jgi:hypothetical protein
VRGFVYVLIAGAPSDVTFTEAPAHLLGFTLDQVEDILETPFQIRRFEKWMTGQTMAHDEKLGTIVYPHDLAGFLLNHPIFD